MTINYEEYDDETLSVVCPECRAAVSGECLIKKPTGGMQYSTVPHRARVDLAHGIEWYCAACDVKTTVYHIVTILSEEERIGSCKAPAAQEPIEPGEPEPKGIEAVRNAVVKAESINTGDIAA